jgi:hypothetical protein
VCTLDARTKATDRLQKVCSEFAELYVELNDCEIEASVVKVIRDSVDRMLMTAMTLQQGLDGSSSPKTSKDYCRW